jgi:pimeloyl-ACP methyl ester carboxylesterase
VTLVLVHGGGHSSRCWEPTIARLRAPAVAVDLPGRGRRPGPLDRVRIADSVDAVVDDIRGVEGGVVLVGHSMAGLTIPGVLARVPERIRHVVFVSCGIPPDGGSLLDVLQPDIRAFAEAMEPSPAGASLTPEQVRLSQCADMDDEQTRFTLEIVVPEAYWPTREPVDTTGLRQPIPRTWVRLLRDETFPPEVQDAMARRAGCRHVVAIDSGHAAMISHPVELAAVLDAVHRTAIADAPPASDHGGPADPTPRSPG